MSSHADAPTDRCEPSANAPARTPGIESRRHARARAMWPARLCNNSGTMHSGWICDVSEGGFGLMSPVNMPVGAMLEIALAVPMDKEGKRSTAVRCKVRVVFCAFVGVQSRLGVQFVALPQATRLAIRRYVLSHA